MRYGGVTLCLTIDDIAVCLYQCRYYRCLIVHDVVVTGDFVIVVIKVVVHTSSTDSTTTG